MSDIDLKHLPESYVIKKFYEYGYGVVRSEGGNTYHCSCPICMEGRSFKKKKRCWYLPAKNLIYCHNCGWSSRPYKWIRTVGDLSRADIIEEIKNGEYNIINIDKIKDEEPQIEQFADNCDDLPANCIDLTNKLQLDYYKGNSVVLKALQYLKNRRLDTAINRPDKYFISLNDPTHADRIVIPFYDADNKVTFYQSRTFGIDEMEKVKYLSKKNAEKTLYGVNNVDDSIKPVFIFEGPIDACFVKNGLAVAGINRGKGSDYTVPQRQQLSALLLNHNVIWVPDSQWIDDTAYEKTISLLEAGECVFIWPKNIGQVYKDFNEICVDKKIDAIPWKFIEQNALCGQSGLLKYKIMMKNR